MGNISTKYSSFWICAVLTLISAAVFYQVYNFEFVDFDDPEYVCQNPNVQAGITFETIKWAFTAVRSSNWHPLTWISHMLDWQLFGSNPAGHHLVNLIFHIANTLLLFLVLKRMTNALWQSAFVAALFALHPLHVESVAWVSERKDVLSTFFWLLTMWAYVRFVSRPKIFNYLWIVVFFAFGLMAKPMLVTLPFVLLLLDYWPLDRLKSKRSLFYLIAEKIPLLAMVLASCIVTYIIQKESETIRITKDYNIIIRTANAFISYIQYIIKMIWPARLSYLYLHPGPNISFFYAVISAVLLLAITIIILRFAKNHKYLVTGWFWYLVTLVPVIGFVQVGIQAMADRYSYITLTGLFIIIAWGVSELLIKWRHKKIVLTLSALLVILIMSVCTYSQLRYWRNSLTLFQHAIDVTENNYMARFSMAKSLVDKNRFSEAVIECQKSLQIKPDDPDVLNILGIAFGQQGKYDEAIKCFSKTLQIKPDFAMAHSNIGYAFACQGDVNEAVLHFTESLRLDPCSVSTHYYLGRILAKSGKANEAVKHFEDAIRLKPDWTEPMNDLAWFLAASKENTARNPDKAIKLARRVCELTDYKNPELLDTLAVAYAAAGDFNKAVETAEKALELCQSPKQNTLEKEIESRLVLFKAGKPYIETR